MILNFAIGATLIIGFVFGGCKNQKVVTTDYSGLIKATVVDMSELDGCNHLLKLEDGTFLEPMNLENEFKKNGMVLYISYKPSKANSVCMKGKLVELSTVKNPIK